ncbi:hypothetical protein PBT90_04090 [Algoriphagus halophytocola]|uniref:DUF454 family protein n=1 Tax=Algoriphagus halophytocola TaxID=2991499 RepID=A0ABY6MK71_9BACT|nr:MULTISPECIES: hypothetical protein [unclassified Algoriphagus]UZD22599.1 hypothetical protein OM944_18350 [Algoriphagus sp. TR-M5]WBL43865.1 hypothetical protein PBT90_04090 [Algoriphagus sp. TR-M9]
MKKLVIPGIAFLIFIAGLAALMVPFIPVGWLLIALSALLLAPYLPIVRKFIGWLSKLDKTGFIEKAGEKAAKLYYWANDTKRAKKLETILEENKPDNKPSKNR